MNKLLTVLLLFLPLTGVLAADNGDVMDVREIDRLRPDSTYKLIWEPHLAKWTDKHLVCCYGVDAGGRHIYVYKDNANREGLWYKTKVSGDAWSIPIRFYQENNRNSYPTLVEDKPGEWIAVWDSSNSPDKKRTAIRFGRLKVE